MELPGSRSTAVCRINNAIKKLDMSQVERHLLAADREVSDPGFYLCEASIPDWNTYVTSEDQALLSRAMEWKAGKMYIVELSGGIHEVCTRALDRAVDRAATGAMAVMQLVPRGSAFVDAPGRRRLEPDASFGPKSNVGATLPQGLGTWSEYHTLNVEVGVSRGWPHLDHKAEEWSEYPGVEYILCIYLSPNLQVRQYKLHSVFNGAIQQPPMEERDIVDPTIVHFDSRRLLGLRGHPNVRLPAGFPQPNVLVPLFPVGERCMEDN